MQVHTYIVDHNAQWREVHDRAEIMNGLQWIMWIWIIKWIRDVKKAQYVTEFSLARWQRSKPELLVVNQEFYCLGSRAKGWLYVSQPQICCIPPSTILARRITRMKWHSDIVNDNGKHKLYLTFILYHLFRNQSWLATDNITMQYTYRTRNYSKHDNYFTALLYCLEFSTE